MTAETVPAPSVLRRLIDDRGIKHTFLAERAGVTRSHFMRLLNRERQPTQQFIDLMSELLGVEPQAFFDGRELLPSRQTQDEGVGADDASGGAHLGTPPALGATA